MSQFHGFAVDGFTLTELDAYGCQWTVEAVQGWFAGSGIRADAQPKSQQNGTWRGRTYREGRVITLRGKVFAPNTTALELAARRLGGVLAGGGSGEFVGSSPAGELTTVVQLEDAPLFDPVSSDAATWQVTVASEDSALFGAQVFSQVGLATSSGGTGLPDPLTYPLTYGLAPGVTPGAVSLANAGTTSYHPRLRINGPVTAPVLTLVETGDVVSYSGSIAAGQHLDINWGEPRRVTIGDNPVSMRHKVSYAGNWLAVPVGGGSLTFSAFDADPAASLSVWSYEGAWE